MEFLFWFFVSFLLWRTLWDILQILDGKYDNRRDKKLIKEVRVMFPDAKDIRLTTVTSNNKEAIDNLKGQLDEYRKSSR